MRYGAAIRAWVARLDGRGRASAYAEPPRVRPPELSLTLTGVIANAFRRCRWRSWEQSPTVAGVIADARRFYRRWPRFSHQV